MRYNEFVLLYNEFVLRYSAFLFCVITRVLRYYAFRNIFILEVILISFRTFMHNLCVNINICNGFLQHNTVMSNAHLSLHRYILLLRSTEARGYRELNSTICRFFLTFPGKNRSSTSLRVS
jgi:hypothetical protein